VKKVLAASIEAEPMAWWEADRSGSADDQHPCRRSARNHPTACYARHRVTPRGPQRFVTPDQVGREQHGGASGVDEAGRAEADRGDLVVGAQFSDTGGYDVLGLQRVLGRDVLTYPCQDPVILVHDARGHLESTDVYRDGQSHGPLPMRRSLVLQLTFLDGARSPPHAPRGATTSDAAYPRANRGLLAAVPDGSEGW
jgi:hypothetical protein